MPQPATRHRHAVPLLALLLALTLVTAGCDTGPGELDAPASLTLEERIQVVENGLLPEIYLAGETPWTLAERMAHYGVPGVSVAVIDGGEIDWARGYGVASATSQEPVTEETLFQAASLSKPVAAAAALLQVEAGTLGLDRPVNEELTSWQVPPAPQEQAPALTLRHLLAHASGIPRRESPGFAADALLVPTLLQLVTGEPPAEVLPAEPIQPPGKVFWFSGANYGLLQLLLEDTTGRPLGDLLAETVLVPAGMTSTSAAEPLPGPLAARTADGHRADGSPLPGGYYRYPEVASAGMWSTPSDLARFLLALQASLGGDDGALLRQQTAREMTTPVVADMGLGFFIAPRQGTFSLQQPGANEGFYSLMVAYPDGRGAVVMTNSDNGEPLAQEILRAIARQYRWPGYLRTPLEPGQVPPEQLDAYTGRYLLGPDRVLTVRREGDQLLADETITDGSQRLFAIGPHRFLLEDPPVVLDFELGPDGRATGYTLETGQAKIDRPRLADDAPPRAVELLEAGDLEAAVAAYRNAPGQLLPRLNNLGYKLLELGRLEAAIAIFRLNAELNPDAPGTWDSLGEAYAANGQTAEAADAGQRVLETLDAAQLPPALKRLLRTRAENRLVRAGRAG